MALKIDVFSFDMSHCAIIPQHVFNVSTVQILRHIHKDHPHELAILSYKSQACPVYVNFPTCKFIFEIFDTVNILKTDSHYPLSVSMQLCQTNYARWVNCLEQWGHQFWNGVGYIVHRPHCTGSHQMFSLPWVIHCSPLLSEVVKKSY